MARTIQVNVLTPEKVVFEGAVEAVYLHMHDGERGFLPGHAPLVGSLGIGMMRLVSGGKTTILQVEGGLAEISKNRLIILAEEAMRKDELSERSIRADLDILADEEKKAAPETKNRLEQRRKKLESRLKACIH